jgi:hypothetical protein
MTIPVCPIDNKEDAIRKIESIVLGDTSFGTFSVQTEGVTGVSGTTSTNLANMLRLPPEPVK